MFKSIEYKLGFYTVLLVVAVAASTYLALVAEYVFSAFGVLLIVLLLWNMYKCYSKFNQNILFLLNALDNGDYSFRFAETKLSPREREFNAMMNRIKEILSNARKEVIENEKFLSIILESVSSGILIVNDSGIVLKSNRAVLQLLGMPVITHLNQLRIVDESYPELFLKMNPFQSVAVKVSNEREEILLNAQCSQVTIRNENLKIILLNNIGNELEMREMESWVKLIRVLTHEIMNSIAPITSLSQTILFSHRMQANDNEPQDELTQNTLEALQTIHTTAKGLVNFVDSYRKFTGIPQPQKTKLDLVALVTSLTNLEAGILQKKNIRLDISANYPNVWVDADESQIKQVLTNLLKNAIEAVESIGDPTIRIEIVRKNNKAAVKVSNNGVPIPADVLPHIFVPFFTTKATGNGIGLSISRYIMRLHGGNLKLHSEKEWTVFRVVFSS
ncbi:MAG: Signal transduction histidine kinase [Bacteroidetes bacterium]|jgi:two-component system, NtrC family, nitrogen regulation sensor histidine kinase NtrY|nr:Signal transduction histidine kinase [Bacteroidota bacterium]